MNRIVLAVPEEWEGGRVDRFLAENIDHLTRSALQRLCEKGAVFVGGSPAQKSRALRAEEEVTVEVPDALPLEVAAEEIPLAIVYEDDDLLVVEKPKGMVVHPAPGNHGGTLVNALLWHCRGSLSGINGVLRPGIVHRIDKDTSGLLMVAKNDRAHASLAEQLRVHSITRVYQAVLYGNSLPDEGKVDAPLGRSPRDRKKMAIVPGGRPAQTHYRVLRRYRGFCHVELRLCTGRTHQIRVHMASLGHPVAGDPVYGPARAIARLQGQCLHAGTLGFVHPATGEYLEFTAPLPAYFTDFLSTLEE